MLTHYVLELWELSTEQGHDRPGTLVTRSTPAALGGAVRLKSCGQESRTQTKSSKLSGVTALVVTCFSLSDKYCPVSIPVFIGTLDFYL